MNNENSNSSKLYFGNLAYSVTSDELQAFLSEKWEVTECKVIEGKGFAFVTFKDWQTANSAKEALNGTEFQGRTLKLDNARENRKPQGSGYSNRRY